MQVVRILRNSCTTPATRGSDYSISYKDRKRLKDIIAPEHTIACRVGFYILGSSHVTCTVTGQAFCTTRLAQRQCAQMPNIFLKLNHNNPDHRVAVSRFMSVA